MNRLKQKIFEKNVEQRIPMLLKITQLIMGLATFVGVIAMAVISLNYNNVLSDYGFAQGNIGKMMIVFADTRSNLRAVIGYQDKDMVTESFEAYQEKKEAFQKYSEEVEKHLVSKKERDIYDDFKMELDEYWTLCEKVIQMGKGGDNTQRTEAQRLAIKDVGPLYEELYADMLSLMDLKVTEGNSVKETLLVIQFIMIGLIVVLTIFAVVIGRKIGSAIIQSILQPLTALAERLKTFEKGDLSSEFPVTENQDEISEIIDTTRHMANELSNVMHDVIRRTELMANADYTGEAGVVYPGDFDAMDKAIHKMNIDMNHTLRDIENSAAQVNVGATNLSETSQSLAEGATEQAGAVQELVASFADISEGVKNAADSLEDSYKMALKYADEANKSKQQMQITMEAMEKISETSRQIESIIGDIEEIAEQTNLLSLNASIEAARAGEAGKGFAVVAAQIGKLAEDSAKSAEHTRSLISSSIEQVVNGNLAVENTSTTITDLVEGMKEIADNSKHVAQLAKAQTEMINQAELGVNQISEVVQSNAAIAEESSATSEELEAEATTLADLVGQFQLKQL